MSRRVLITALFSAALQACSGGGGPPLCSFSNPAKLATSTWPKARANIYNTAAARVTSFAAAPEVEWAFAIPAPSPSPTPGPEANGRFIASPVISNETSRIYIGSTDHKLYALNTDGTLVESFGLITSGPITAAALVARRDDQDALFVGSGDGRLYGVTEGGAALKDFWPFPLGGFISTGPTLTDTDGTVYTGGVGGVFAGVCPNGIARFTLGTVGTQSSAAIGPDGTVYFGADDRELRALEPDGRIKWAFSTSAPIFAAPVIEVATDTNPVAAVYVADKSGHVYKVNAATGQPLDFDFTPASAILSSLALANGHLYYVAADDNLHAINTDGTPVWTVPVPTAGAIATVSSPAVAFTDEQVIVVVGSTDGNLYFVVDDGTSTPPSIAIPLPPGEPIESSPAISSDISGDGIAYVGSDAGVVYAVRIGGAPSGN